MRRFKGREKSRSDITARADDAFKNANYAEYMVDRKAEGTYKRNRVLVIIGYVLFALIFAAVMIITKLFVIIAVLPIFIWMLVFYTWLYFSQSFFYTVESARFTIVKVYGGKKEDDFVSVAVKDISLIGPYDEYRRQIPTNAKVYEALSSKKAQDVYVALFKENGSDAVICFEATEHILKALKYYNSAAVVMKKTER